MERAGQNIHAVFVGRSLSSIDYPDLPVGRRFLTSNAARQSGWESRDNQDENAPLPG